MIARRLSQIDPGAALGVLGGGQLGAMFAAAARRLGYRVTVWDPDPHAPAHSLADRSVTTPFTDANGADRFLEGLSAATYEWENVPASLCERLEAQVPVRPNSAVLRTIQHRIAQKRFLSGRGLPVAPFLEIRCAADLDRTPVFGYPCLLKTATAGYDGKGQWRLEGPEQATSLQTILPKEHTEGRAWILESVVRFERELSVLVVCEEGGRCASYPVVDNVHEQGVLRLTTVPATIDPDVAEEAQRLSEAAVGSLDSPGVYCVELFQGANGALFINEIAPRPHNSGHYTLDACTVSQFEQQVRMLCGLPRGEIRLTSQAAMINLLGLEASFMTQREPFAALLAEPGVHVHLYRKREVRAGRKMGHVTVTGGTGEEVRQKAERLLLGIKACGIAT